MITGNGALTPCSSLIRNVKVNFGNFFVEEDFFVFPLGKGPNLVLGVQWLYSLGDYNTNHQSFQLKFKSNGKEVVLQGIKEHAVQTVTTKRMERVLQKEEVLWAVGIFLMEGKKSRAEINFSFRSRLQKVLKRHSRVFDDFPTGHPPSRGFEHAIELECSTFLQCSTRMGNRETRERGKNRVIFGERQV